MPYAEHADTAQRWATERAITCWAWFAGDLTPRDLAVLRESAAASRADGAIWALIVPPGDEASAAARETGGRGRGRRSGAGAVGSLRGHAGQRRRRRRSTWPDRRGTARARGGAAGRRWGGDRPGRGQSRCAAAIAAGAAGRHHRAGGIRRARRGAVRQRPRPPAAGAPQPRPVRRQRPRAPRRWRP